MSINENLIQTVYLTKDTVLITKFPCVKVATYTLLFKFIFVSYSLKRVKKVHSKPVFPKLFHSIA